MAFCQRVCRDRFKAGRPARQLIGPAVLGPRSADGAAERTLRCAGCSGELGFVHGDRAVVLLGRIVLQRDAPGRYLVTAACPRCESLRLVMTVRAPALAGQGVRPPSPGSGPAVAAAVAG